MVYYDYKLVAAVDYDYKQAVVVVEIDCKQVEVVFDSEQGDFAIFFFFYFVVLVLDFRAFQYALKWISFVFQKIVSFFLIFETNNSDQIVKYA